MVEFGVDVLRAWLNPLNGERKDVKMRRNCEGKSGFGVTC